MSLNDPLGDMLTRLRNGQMARKREVRCLYSKQHVNVCKVLKDEGFIREYRVEDLDNNKKDLVVELKYIDGEGVIRQIGRVSRPGRRTYTGVKDMKRFYNGLGILVVSTPKGVMTDQGARAANVGGEVLCQVF